MSQGELRPFQTAEAAGLQVLEALEPHCSQIEIAGSIRREVTMVHDADIIAVDYGPAMQLLKDQFGASPGSNVQTTVLVDTVSVDVWFVPEVSWGAALLFVTGSVGFNIGCRVVAQRRGWKLSRYGLFNRSGQEEVIASRTEEEVLNALDLQWIPPEDRSIDQGSWTDWNNLVNKYSLPAAAVV